MISLVYKFNLQKVFILMANKLRGLFENMRNAKTAMSSSDLSVLDWKNITEIIFLVESNSYIF